MKKCIDCNIDKKESDFNLRNKKLKLRQSRCKICESKNAKHNYLANREKRLNKQRGRDILNKYGFSVEEYDSMLVLQGNKCAICGNKEIGRKSAKFFNIDYCSKTGKVRGLLCHNCTVTIGKINDSKKWLKDAIKYLS